MNNKNKNSVIFSVQNSASAPELKLKIEREHNATSAISHQPLAIHRKREPATRLHTHVRCLVFAAFRLVALNVLIDFGDKDVRADEPNRAC